MNCFCVWNECGNGASLFYQIQFHKSCSRRVFPSFALSCCWYFPMVLLITVSYLPISLNISRKTNKEGGWGKCFQYQSPKGKGFGLD